MDFDLEYKEVWLVYTLRIKVHITTPLVLEATRKDRLSNRQVIVLED